MEKIATDLEQSKKLAGILPIETADMFYCYGMDTETGKCEYDKEPSVNGEELHIDVCDVPAWSLSALLGVLPKINDIPLTLEKDGCDGYYYHIEYKDKILIPYNKNAVDACVEMIIKLHELNLL